MLWQGSITNTSHLSLYNTSGKSKPKTFWQYFSAVQAWLIIPCALVSCLWRCRYSFWQCVLSSPALLTGFLPLLLLARWPLRLAGTMPIPEQAEKFRPDRCSSVTSEPSGPKRQSSPPGIRTPRYFQTRFFPVQRRKRWDFLHLIQPVLQSGLLLGIFLCLLGAGSD